MLAHKCFCRQHDNGGRCAKYDIGYAHLLDNTSLKDQHELSPAERLFTGADGRETEGAPACNTGSAAMEKKSFRYERGLEKCLSNASSARTAELEELWYTMADSYRCLAEIDKRAITFRSWRKNNFAPLSDPLPDFV